MICPECNGRGETIYYVETDRDENTVTIKQRKGICRTCNGSGEKPKTNADRIRAMTDEELATFISEIAGECEKNTECHQYCYGCDIEYCVHESCLKWLQQPAKTKEES